MSDSTPRRKSRRLLIAGLVILGACAVLLLGIEFLYPEANSRSAGAPHSAPTIYAIQAMPTATPAPAVVDEGARGDLQFDYPLSLVVDQDDVVQLQIVPQKQVASTAPLRASGVAAKLLVESDANQQAHKSVSYEIPVYAVMSAELSTASSADLNIVAGSESKQTIDLLDRNFWTWSIVAKRGGEYHVTLRIFGYDGLADTAPSHQVVSDTRIINVQERPLLERIMQGISDNWLVLFGAGGPIALVVLVLSFYFARREAQKPKSGT